MSYLRDRLASPKLTRYLAVIATLLSIPSLFHGLEVDDRLQRICVVKQGKFSYWPGSPTNLFTFFNGDPALTQNLRDMGVATWWTDPHAKVTFFRPISSLLHWCEYKFLQYPFLMHVHSLVWYLGTIAIAVALYRRFLREPWVMGLAGWMFAIDYGHGLAVGWLAQRNTLISGLFGLLSLYFHDLHRRDEGRKHDVFVASIFLGLALFSAEAALGILPYLFAHAWTFDRQRWFRVLLPFAPPVLLWVLAYKLTGSGTHGSGMYVDPASAPLSFLGNVLRHAPVLVASELGMPGADFFAFLPFSIRMFLLAFAITSILLFFFAIRPLLRIDPITRFFVLGGVLSVLPACATVPATRLTFFASFGLVGALAQLIAGWRDRASWFPEKGFSRWRTMPVVLWCSFAHLVWAPVGFVYSTHQMTIFEQIIVRLAKGIPDDSRIESQRLIVVNAPEPVFIAYILLVRHDSGRTSPGKMLSLTSGSRPIEVTRQDASTLVVTSPHGLVRSTTDLLSRDDRPFVVGDRYNLSDVSIEVTRVDTEGWPIEAKFMFAQPLEHDAYRWMQWQNQTLVPLELPQVGQKVAFPAQVIQMF